ncbi:MIP/aquaporin family protein [Flagellimonas meridianipacifica]|uniref:Glycerol uptake facilitator protein n=1 Tax=Flagellimonas meridianipacifica TaxID=1080225 RepID=A0A2T0MFY4_9FLAO|nr:MIP/aquaporin family protein [Allomuricauda pacifica]PRX56479.1 glycerol uptake facilitator protein [Allomuricauda pacifica]
MTPFVAEIVGTFLLILLGCGVNANVSLKGTFGSQSGWIVITTGWAFAVYTGVVVAGPYSGAHMNPAVTVGLALSGDFSIYDVPHYIIAQFIGAMLGAFFVWAIHKDHFDATEDGNSKRAVFCNAPAIPNTFLNVLTETIGTFVLVFAVLYFTDATLMKDNSIIGLGSLGALPVALIVWGIGLSLGGTTGYAINPARDLGPRIVHALVPIKNKGSNGWGYSWIPVVGPILGAALAAFLSMWLQ